MMSRDQNWKNLMLDYIAESAHAFAKEEAQRFPPGVVFTPIRQKKVRTERMS
ncbi:MAG TPA: hypothetical protein VKX17_22960 [Planctomycetota bacterium]|nr:hypothetical protein [Planctomycetota bacterium]